MAQNKSYQYKVYQPVDTTLYNLVKVAGFEGFDLTSAKYYGYWSKFDGGETAINRSKAQALNPTAGTALSFDGLTSYVNLPCDTYPSSGSTSFVYPLVGGWFYKPNWSDGTRQAIVSKDTQGSNVGGFGLHLNFTPGYLSFICRRNSAWGEAKILTSSITAGWHHIVGSYDGRYTKIYIDGNLANTGDAGGSFSIQYAGGGGLDNHIGLGVQAQYGSIVTPTGFNYSGYMEELYLITDCSSLTATDIRYFYENQFLEKSGYAGDYHHFSFDEASGNTIYDDGTLQKTGVASGCSFVTGLVNTGFSARVIPNNAGAANQGIKTSSNITVSPSTAYTASVWVKGDPGSSYALRVKDQSGSVIGTTAFNVNPDGNFTRASLGFTTGASVSGVSIEIYCTSGTTNPGFWVDGVMLEAGSILHDFFDSDLADTSLAKYTYDPVNSRHVATTTIYNYLTTWKDVVNEPKISTEINTGGGEVEVELARNVDSFGERSDIYFKNQVQIYVVDDDSPSGNLIFTGYISNYKQSYTEEKIVVTLLGYGSQLDDYMIENGELQVLAQEDQSGTDFGFGINSGGGIIPYAGQSFVVPSNTKLLSSIELLMYAWDSIPSQADKNASYPLILAIYDDYAKCTAAAKSKSVKDAIGVADAPNSVASTVYPYQGTWTKFTFRKNVRVTPGQTYYFACWIPGYGGAQYTHYIKASNSNPVSGNLFWYDGLGLGAGTYTLPKTDLCFRINSAYGKTIKAYNSQDPSVILKSIIDEANRQGCIISYDANSIQTTGSVVSYTFNTSTILDGIKKCLELAPVDWYWYMDQATNKVYFKKKSTTVNHSFVLGKHFTDIDFEKRSEDIVNKIYFTGGDLGAGVNFYKKYTNATSASLYGDKLLNYSDNRVTLTSTADIIANSILQSKSFPELRTSFHVLDKTYDLESVNLGDTLVLRGFSNKNLNLWDVAIWDQAYWDFDIADIQTVVLQIVRKDYTPDKLGLTLSSIPPDIAKRTEDIKRNLDKVNTSKNPSTPS